MSAVNDVHIIRVNAQQHGPIEVLCGFKTPPGGNRVAGPPNMATCWQCILLKCGRPVPTEPVLPEHERLALAKKTNDATQLVGAFVSWLAESKKLILGRWNEDDELIPARENIQNLLAEYFHIDTDVLENEKQALLEYLRATNEARTWALSEGKKALAK